MAQLYWVGGTANWDGIAGTKWASSSGGTGGQPAPGAFDNVFFDANSGPVTVTLTAIVGCLNLNFTGFTGTFAGSTNFSLYAGLTLSSSMTWTNTSTISFSGTGIIPITTEGKTIGPIVLNDPGGRWQLGSAFANSGAITLTNGQFKTNNYALTTSGISSSNSNTRTIDLGSSTVAINGGVGIDFTTSTNLTFNAGTSSISLSSAGVTLAGGNRTFYNVSFTNTTASNVEFIQGANTFNNLTFTGTAAAGFSTIYFYAGQTINGTLSTTGTAGNRRILLRSDTVGIAYTLTINGTPSLTDADFRDLYVIGTAAPIDGTRIGNLRGCSGINFSTPKTVYWNAAASANWSDDVWAATSGGSTSTSNFPLAQDTAIFNNASAGNQLILNSAIGYVPSVDFSARTVTFTVNFFQANTCYGNWTFGSGVTTTSGSTLTFSGRNTQTITSAGIAFSGSIFIDSYGGTVQLADALNNGSNNVFSVTNGTFDTKNYSLTTGGFSSNNSNVRTILFGSSTISIASTVFSLSSTNLTFNCGTSQITMSNSAQFAFTGGSQTFYNVSFTGISFNSIELQGTNTFNNLLFTPYFTDVIKPIIFSANQTINGTLTTAAATAVRRIWFQSNTSGTTRTLTVNSLAATDCDFSDIKIAGTAAGSSPIRAGDCGNNTGITFSSKTVYWNLAGTQNWSAAAWATTSGGTPNINNFPLAQDTAVFDNAGSAGTVNINTAWNLPNLNFSARTSAMTFNHGGYGPTAYGGWAWGSGVTSTATPTGSISFASRGIKTFTSNGVTTGFNVTVNAVTGTLQLGDSLTLGSTNTLTLISGTFDAVTYNVTVGNFLANGSAFPSVLRMGSGSWTLTASGLTPWNISASNFTFYKGTANIFMPITNQFSGFGLSYNKLTLTGSAASSTSFITGNNQFTELASTVTIAHTISLGSTTQTLGAWTVTGTAGNVVTISGTATITIAGARVSGVDYLALGTTTISATSLGEFYAGANSTGGTNAILTAAPTAVTRYWRGGTGTWDATTTTNWSATSGGSGGASVPTSADAVVFDSASNATAYTVTCTATQLRCAALTMAGPATGNVTWAGLAPLAVHGNINLDVGTITRTYTGAITLSGSSLGKTITTNGLVLASAIIVNGVGCGWTLGSALDIGGATFTITNGSFNVLASNLTASQISSDNANARTINFGSGTITLSGSNGILFGTTETTRANLTVTAGTSQINLSGSLSNISGNNQTFYNVSFTTNGTGSITINGSNTFNNLSFTGIGATGFKNTITSGNQTITGTLTFSAGNNATCRMSFFSDTLGTTRTLTCAAFSGTDVDFRDITIAGAAAPVSGTRLGDCKGNSGITFPAAKTVYWRPNAGNNWSSISWGLTPTGAQTDAAFPLAQDTAVMQTASPSSGNTVTIDANWHIGTIDMSARTSNTMTLATGSTSPTIYGNWINGTGTTLSGTGTLTFAGRGSQTITSAGKTWTQSFTISNPGGTITQQDSLINSFTGTAFIFYAGTYDLGGYNATFAGPFSASGAISKTFAVNTGTFSSSAASFIDGSTSSSFQITGSGTISFTSASAKSFFVGLLCPNITLNQGGSGILSISGNNTFYDITNTYSATGATTIALSNTTQRLTQFTASGTAGKILSITGSSSSSPGTLIITGATKPNVDYVSILNVRAYPLTDTWFAGSNSVNNGSLGWTFASGTVGKSNFLLLFS